MDHVWRSSGLLVAAGRHADRCHAGGGEHRLLARAPLFDRLHGRGSEPPAVFRLSLAVHLRDADAGDGRQPRAAVLRLGGRRLGELPSDRLLVSEAVSERGRDQGFYRQSRRRFRFCARHLRRLHADRVDRLRDDLRRSVRADRQDHRSLRLASGCADPDLPAAVYGRDGQIRAVPAAHLAARRDGRPDAGLGADPRRDHGHRRRVHGGAAVTAVRTGADRTGLRDVHRRHHGVLCGDHWSRPERYQTHRRLFDLFAARLHVRGDGGGRLFGGHVPLIHARLLQGVAVLRVRLGDLCDASRAGHPQHGRPVAKDSLHVCSDVHRYVGADGLPDVRRLFLQGCHHRIRVCVAQYVRDLRLSVDGRCGGSDLLLFLAPDLQDLLR